MPPRPRFELGFDPSRFQSRKVTHLVSGSAAEEAGLREGMPLAGWSVYGGNVDREVEIQVKEGEALRSIKHLPHAARMVDMYEFHAIPGAQRQRDCLRWVEAR